MLERLRVVPLFADLGEEDLRRIADAAYEVNVPEGDLLFVEGEQGDRAFVIVEGEVEILKQSGKRQVLLAVREADAVIGEMSLLQESPRTATGRARTPVKLLAIPKSTLDGLLEVSPTASRRLFRVLLEHTKSTEARLRQSERMAQLGTLTAGLAHELNNPAAAVKRGSELLREAMTGYAAARARVEVLGLSGDTLAELERLEQVVADAVASPPELDALTRSDREGDIEDWLDEHDVPRGWELTPGLVEAGVDGTMLAGIEETFGDDAGPVVEFLAHSQGIGSLLREVEEGSGRLSAIVKALKSYSYLDQAPVQRIEVTAGIDDTLLILKRKLDGITVVREYAPDLPEIEAYASELNQVWTNLIDNAADALAESESDDPRVTIRVAPHEDGVRVEVEDNGPGIPPDVVPRIFDSFFTTKPPGSGTGLGLDISQSIVVVKHGGEITVDSEPGRTTFRVDLPAQPPA